MVLHMHVCVCVYVYIYVSCFGQVAKVPTLLIHHSKYSRVLHGFLAVIR